MAIRQKTTVTFRTTASCPTHARTEIPIRDLVAIVDEPLERGGTNMGLTPTETALSALIACTNVIGHKCAHRLGVDLGTVTIKAACDFDRRGVLLTEEIDIPFPAITLDVMCDGPATAADLANVGAQTAKFCAIAKMFVAAGTNLNVNWTKAET
jgi:uncharacterized OsmC-like protein